jgi:hypothetical protein
MPASSNENFPIRGGKRRDWVDSSKQTVVQRFFLTRLENLVARRRVPDPTRERWQSKLIDHAIYSTYRDCVDLGLSDEARTVLRGELGNTPRESAST